MTARVSSFRVPATLREVDLGFTTEVDLTALVQVPQLRRIRLRWIDRPVDLAPFAMWDGNAVTIETTATQRLTHRDTLPPTVRIQRIDSYGVRYD